MIDVHSHFLPAIDDGSNSAAQSEQMLRTSFEQGVDVIVATPHFYAWNTNPKQFLSRRQKALESICYDASSMPRILLGAEVAYYDGLQHSEDLKLLCIGKSRLLLIEMPFESWTERTVNSICSLPANQEIVPVLAHIERYLHFGANRKWLPVLQEKGVLIQSNCGFFLSRMQGRKAVKMLRQGAIQFIGTDCHNMQDRRPNMELLVQKIASTAGKELLPKMDARARTYLCLSDME